MPNLRFGVLIMGLMAVLVFFQYRLWFQSDGIVDLVRLKRMLANQSVENDKLKKSNDELLMQIKHLQNSQEEVESRARNELGMTKKGEIFYQLVD